VVRGAATATSASRIGRAVEEGLMAIGAREGDGGIVLYYRIVDGGWRGRARACAGEGCCELGEDGPHTHAHTQLLHLAKAVQAGLCSA
jgi:hypothetical protein